MKKAVVLAAGKGTRMKSSLPKVMQPIGGRPMILELLATLKKAGMGETVVVVGPDMENLSSLVAPEPTVIQQQQLGTGHAVLSAKEKMGIYDGPMLVFFGDGPLIKEETIRRMLAKYEEGNDVVVLAFEPEDPARYGRLMMHENGLDAIVEYKDATPEQRAIRLCNAGPMCLNAAKVWPMLSKIENTNAAGEFYLTDIVSVGRKEGLKMDIVVGDALEVCGINTKNELAAVEKIYQSRRRAEAMENGVTLLDPETTYFSYDTQIEKDVVVEPCVFFGTGVYVEEGARVVAFSRVQNQRIKAAK